MDDTPTARLTIQNSAEGIGRALRWVEAFCERHALGNQVVSGLCVPLDELLRNTISYGYACDGPHRIDIALELEDTRISVSIIDDARPFDPTDPNAASDLETPATAGGLGLHFVRHLADGLTYVREDGHNKTTIMKSITRSSRIGPSDRVSADR